MFATIQTQTGEETINLPPEIASAVLRENGPDVLVERRMHDVVRKWLTEEGILFVDVISISKQIMPEQSGYISSNPDINVLMLSQLRATHKNFQQALERIANGEPNPAEIAATALGRDEDTIEPPDL